jgi:hypothetical protein
MYKFEFSSVRRFSKMHTSTWLTRRFLGQKLCSLLHMVRRKFVQNMSVRFGEMINKVVILDFRGKFISPFLIWASEETGSWADKKRAETWLTYAARRLPASMQREGRSTERPPSGKEKERPHAGERKRERGSSAAPPLHR